MTCAGESASREYHARNVRVERDRRVPSRSDAGRTRGRDQRREQPRRASSRDSAACLLAAGGRCLAHPVASVPPRPPLPRRRRLLGVGASALLLRRPSSREGRRGGGVSTTEADRVTRTDAGARRHGTRTVADARARHPRYWHGPGRGALSKENVDAPPASRSAFRVSDRPRLHSRCRCCHDVRGGK